MDLDFSAFLIRGAAISIIIREAAISIILVIVGKGIMGYFRRDEARLREREEWDAKLAQSGNRDFEEPPTRSFEKEAVPTRTNSDREGSRIAEAHAHER